MGRLMTMIDRRSVALKTVLRTIPYRIDVLARSPTSKWWEGEK
jgi:hypothetical protein